MNPVLFVTDYLKWHYGTGLFDILRVWGNFLWFVIHTSSFFELLKTLFSPWKRMQEDKPSKGTFDPGYYIGSLVINFLMRMVGFLVRLVIIALAIVAFSIIFTFGAAFLLFWFVSPFAIFFIFFNGLAFLSL